LGNFGRIGVFILITAGIVGYLQTGAGLFEKVKNSGLRIQLNSMDRALELYKKKKRKYPRDFGAFVRSEFGQDGQRDPSKDPWGGYYVFTKTGSGFDLSSAGADGRFGSDDDVIWRRERSTAGIVRERAKISKRRVVSESTGQKHDDPLLVEIERSIEKRIRESERMSEEELNRLLTTLLEQNWLE
jgi:hypothetical protein